MSFVLKAALPIIAHGPLQGLLDATKDPAAIQEKVLFDLIRRNKVSLFGLEHDFNGIKTVDDYRSRVPIRDYEGFRPYIDRMLNGQHPILTREKPQVYASTSGTTGKAKLLPVTESFRKALSDLSRCWLTRTFEDHPSVLDEQLLFPVSPAIEGYTPSGKPFGAMTGMTYLNNSVLIKRKFALPYKVMTIESYDLRYYLMLRLALEQKVSLALTSNPSTWLRLAQIGHQYAEWLHRGIRDGTIGFMENEWEEFISEHDVATMELIAQDFFPNRERAFELDRYVEESGEAYLSDAWPDLKILGCWLGGSAGIQAKLLSNYYRHATLRDVGYRASEAAMSVPIADETAAGLPSLIYNFMEFVPADKLDDEQPETRLLHELEDGREYGILLTTSSGLYRYDINDVVRVEGFYQRCPLISFVRKGRDMANLTGEKLHANHVIAAMAAAEQSSGVGYIQFTTTPIVADMRYDLLVEPIDARISESQISTLRDHFDKALQVENEEYEVKRKSGRLHPPQVHQMLPGWSDGLKRHDVKAGMRDAQYKWKAIQLQWSDWSRSQVQKSL